MYLQILKNMCNDNPQISCTNRAKQLYTNFWRRIIMNAVVVKNELQISQWASLVQECQSSGMKKSDWLRSKGITKDQYYYWRRRVMDHSLQAMNASFVEIPQPSIGHACAYVPTSENTAASITLGKLRLDIHDSASEGFIKTLLRAVSDAQ